MSEAPTRDGLAFTRAAGGDVVVPAWLPGGRTSPRPLVFPVVAGGKPDDDAEGRAASPAPPSPEEASPATVAGGASSDGHAPPSAEDASSPAPIRPSAPPPPPGAGYSQPPAMAAAPPRDSVVPEAVAGQQAELLLELERRIEAFSEAAVDLGALRARVVAQAESSLLDLAMDLAQAIVEREVERDPEVHRAMARAALATLGDADAARLRVSPAAHEAIVETFEDASVVVDGVRVNVEADDSLDGLGCVADSPRARVDGRLVERLRAARRAVEDERRRQAQEESS